MIRSFLKEDVEDIIDVWYQASLIAHPFLTEEFLEMEKINIREVYLPNTKTWVFENGKNLDAFISMIGNEVGAVFVRPEKQNTGIGKKLLDHVSKLHAELEVDVFEKNNIGRAFYKKYGFKYLRKYIHEETRECILRLKFVN